MKLLAASLLLLSSLQDGKVELRWSWQKGGELVYKSSQRIVMEILGQTIDQLLGSTYSMTVTDVSDEKVATILVKYLAVSTKGFANGAEWDYDSERDKTVPAGPPSMQAKMIGQSFTMKLNAQGRVLDVAGYDKILETMMDGVPENPLLKQMFSNESFKGMMQQMAPPLPEPKVGKDDTWAADYVVKMPMLGGMKFSQSSKVTELKDQIALIEQDIKIELKPSGDKDNPLAGLVELMDGKGKASAVFSLEKGCFLTQKSTTELKIGVSGQEMPMKTVVELKLVSKK